MTYQIIKKLLPGICIGCFCFIAVPGQGVDADRVLQHRSPAGETVDNDDLSNKALMKKNPPKFSLSDELKEKLQVTDEDKLEYKDVLKNSKIRIIKLWNDTCGDKNVIDVRDKICAEQSAFSIGSYYSLLIKDYSSLYASIGLVKGEFLAQNNEEKAQFLVDLGAIDLNSISKDTNEVNVLRGIKISDKTQPDLTKKLAEGFELQGLKIAARHPFNLNHTYLLRSIFIDNSYSSMAWKKETIFAFRVVRQKDNVITILLKPILEKWV